MNRSAIKIQDTETRHSWRVDRFNGIGPMLRRIREETPAGFQYERREFKSMTQVELVTRINTNLRPNELPISVWIVQRLETGRLVFGGNLMRLMQVSRALRLTVNVGRNHGK